MLVERAEDVFGRGKIIFVDNKCALEIVRVWARNMKISDPSQKFLVLGLGATPRIFPLLEMLVWGGGVSVTIHDIPAGTLWPKIQPPNTWGIWEHAAIGWSSF